MIPAPKPRAYRLRDYDDTLATLAQIRDDRGITYAAIAADLGVDRSDIAKWLHGERRPLAHRLVELAQALGYDLALIPREDA